MSVRNLDHLLTPRSSRCSALRRAPAVGATVWRNLRAGGFTGPIHAVNPKHRSLDGAPVFALAADLAAAADLAILCSPPATVAGRSASIDRPPLVTSKLCGQAPTVSLDARAPPPQRSPPRVPR